MGNNDSNILQDIKIISRESVEGWDGAEERVWRGVVVELGDGSRVRVGKLRVNVEMLISSMNQWDI